MIHSEIFLQPQLVSYIEQSMLHCFSGLISYLTEKSLCSTVSPASSPTSQRTVNAQLFLRPYHFENTYCVIPHPAERLTHTQRRYNLVYGWLKITYA